MSSRAPPPKKPSGGRANVRRLLSKDSLSSLASFTKHSREPSEGRDDSKSRRTAQHPTLAPLDEAQTERNAKPPWMEEDLVSSPMASQDGHDPFDEYAAAANGQPAKLKVSRPTLFSDPSAISTITTAMQSTTSLDIGPSRSSTGTPPPASPSRVRWDQLRHHVLPESTVASSPNPSFTSFSQLNTPAPVPSTPRPSRLARLGFRHVVNDAREVADELTRRFADDVQRACWAVRFGELRPARSEREGAQTNTLGSTLHLPFMSSTSLPLAGLPSTNNLSMPSSFKHGLRGMTSMANLNPPQIPQSGSRMSSLVALQAVLNRYASLMQERATYGILPYEKEVLSVLMISFLGQSLGQEVDDERQLSLEIFEVIIRRWKSPLLEGYIERCLWCCKAATSPAQNARPRILNILNTILTSSDNPLTSPTGIQTVLPNIALLVPYCQNSGASRSVTLLGGTSDLSYIHELIARILAGAYGSLDLDELEQRYQALAEKTDTEGDLRQGLCIDALMKCLDFGTLEQKKDILRVVERYWPSPDPTIPSTPLRLKVHLGKIITFFRSTLNLVRKSIKHSDASTISASDRKVITQLFINRALPEVECLASSDDSMGDAQSLAVRLALALLGFDADMEDESDDTFADPRQSEVKEIVLDWLNGKSTIWRNAIQRELRDFALGAEWTVVVPMASMLIFNLPENSRKTVVGLMIPQFQERMVDDSPPASFKPLTNLLTSFGTIYPQVFYKPLFICAASTKEEIVARQLAILVSLAHYMPEFWTTDAEMLSVALMSDPGATGKGKAKEIQLPVWGKARLGQTAVLLELIGNLRSVREEHNRKHDNGLASNISIARIGKFANAIETRLAILIEAKEKNSALPLSQRILFSQLFLETRHITRNLKSTAWLTLIITWTMQHRGDLEQESTLYPPITDDSMDEIDEIWGKLGIIYSFTKTSLKPASQRRTTSVISPRAGASFNEGAADSREMLIDSRLNLLESLSKDPLCTSLEVFVALSGALKYEDYVRVGPLIWDKCLDLNDTKAVINACFVCMMCAEKAQNRFLDLLLARLQSPSSSVRRETVEKLSIISSWRFQLLSLPYITDRAYRRPFKLARPPLSFVATDVGDSKYIPEDDLEETAGGKGLSADIRRRLHEIGWDEDEKPIDQQLEWRRTPMSLLGSNQLDQISTPDAGNDDNRLSDASPSPVASPSNTPLKSPRSDGVLLRRNSSSNGQHAGKRRPVFVQPLVAIFIPLVKLAMDSDFSVSSVARELILDYMRDDPAVLCRPVVDILSSDTKTVDSAITTLRNFLHLNKVLPPRLTHHAFNHLAGFLKFLAKDPSIPDTLQDLAYTVPILARFAPQVSEMSVRAIRRAKIEVFLFPSGSLYFPESAPLGPMFPRGPGFATNPFDSRPEGLVNMIMIRMAQNLLFVDILKRSPQDVHVVRKSWTPFELIDIMGFADDNDIVPRRGVQRGIPEHSKTSFRLSLSYARTHLLFVAQVFRCLTRHLNDRNEFATFLDGVNRILLRHGDDIGIVSHALIIYMIASTRFRRLVSSGTGFMLFLPALLKVYCEAEGDSSVREAIEYAAHRFFAVHEEVFVYQALQVVSSLVSQPSTDGAWISKNAYYLLNTLKSVPLTHDAAGIRDANKSQEEETALAITADERPQMFLASLRKDSRAGAEKLQSSLSVEIFDTKRFHPDNIIRMLLTVIAHDPTIRRAQWFMRVFRFLVPELYEASTSARNVLKEGVDALGTIVASKMVKIKGAELSSAKLKTGEKEELETQFASSKPIENPASACDLQVVRSDYLLIFSTFVKCGGAIRDSGLVKALDIVKAILREASMSPESNSAVCLFLGQIGSAFSIRQDTKFAINVLREFAPIISAHGSILDLTGLLDSLVTLCSAPNFANDTKFSTVVVAQICSAALEICEMAAQENILSTLKFVPSLITLLAQSVCLLKSDVIAELEKRDPSPAFLSGIVLPFIFQLRTTAELATETQWTDSWRQDAHARAWVRLLSFAMTAFQNQPTNVKASRASMKRSPSFNDNALDPGIDGEQNISRGSLRKARRRPSGQSSVVVSVRLAMAFITLKAVVLRGEEDISAVFPGAWVRVGALLRSTLREGSALFALRNQYPSAPPSPAISPLSSTTFTELIDKATERKHKRSSSSTLDTYLAAPSRPSRPSSPSQRPIRHNSVQEFPCPRFVDYLAWSILEFISLRRTPLTIQLRTYMHERAVSLSEALNSDEFTVGNANLSAYSRARRSLRPVSNMYSKPRFRSGSATPTPEASPRLGPSDPNLSFAGNLMSVYGSPGPGGPELNRSSHMGQKGRSPIIHLGITPPPSKSFLSPSSVPASASAGSTLAQSNSSEALGQNDVIVDVRQVLAMTSLQSAGLVRRTFERIRVVQCCLGYNTFLPIPENLARSNDTGNSQAGLFDHSAGGMGSTTTSPRFSMFVKEEEPEVRAWTKRKAAMQLMTEAQDLLHAWQIESAITASVSDTVQGEGSLSAAASTEAVSDIAFASFAETLP